MSPNEVGVVPVSVLCSSTETWLGMASVNEIAGMFGLKWCWSRIGCNQITSRVHLSSPASRRDCGCHVNLTLAHPKVSSTVELVL